MVFVLSNLVVGGCSVSETSGASSPPGNGDSVEVGHPDFDGTAREWATAMAGCLREAGYPAEVDGTGVWVPVDGEQRQALSQADATCKQSIGILPVEPLTDEFLRAHYWDLLETKECLGREGYSVDEAPSVDAFVETYLSDPWHPYSSLNSLDISDEEWDRLNEVCPQP